MTYKGGIVMSKIGGFLRRLWPFRKREEIKETQSQDKQ